MKNTMTEELDAIRKFYCIYGYKETARIENCSVADLKKLVKQYGWKRPAYKLPAVCKMVRSGKRTEDQYPNVNFSLFNKIKPKNLKDFLLVACKDDTYYDDLFWTLQRFPTFMQIQTPDLEWKWLKKMRTLEPHLSEVLTRLKTEYNRL